MSAIARLKLRRRKEDIRPRRASAVCKVKIKRTCGKLNNKTF